MSARQRLIASVVWGLLLAWPVAGAAQSAPVASSTTGAMDMDAMPGMPMPAPRTPRQRKRVTTPASPVPQRHPDTRQPTMPGMVMPQAPPASDSPSAGTHDMDHGAMPGMRMVPMQGGNTVPGTRSADYSDGVGPGSMQGMDMADDAPLGMLRLDQLEAFHSREGNGQAWEIQGGYGTDRDKLWLRSEGEHSGGTGIGGDVEAFWSHAVAAFWNTQSGLRHDLGDGPQRNWVAFGMQGLAPYWFEVDATGYVGPSGRTAARLRVDYQLLFTQRLILQPQAEVNLYGRDDPQRRIGRGVADVQFGLRLRYEIHRQFAPYIGVNWLRRVDATARYARLDGQSILDRQLVAGVRIWF